MARIGEILLLVDPAAELGGPAVDPQLVDAFQWKVEAALDEIGNRTGRQIVDKSMTRTIDVPDDWQGHVTFDLHLGAAARACKANWIDEAGAKTEIAAGGIIVDPQRVDDYGAGLYRVHYNAANGLWPDWAAGRNKLEVSLVVGMREVPKAIVQAGLSLAHGYLSDDQPDSPAKGAETDDKPDMDEFIENWAVI